MNKNLLFAFALAFVACNSTPQKETESVKVPTPGPDSVAAVPDKSCNCEQLQNEVDSLKAEISGLKKKKKKKDHAKESDQINENDRPAEKIKKKETAAVGKRDSDGSIQCSFVTNGVRCKKRTFAKNGKCYQHGADADVK